MMRHQRKKVKHKREFRYPGICEAAKELGVNRSHLYRVLSGERVSPRIEASVFYKRTMAARQEFKHLEGAGASKGEEAAELTKKGARDGD